VASHGALPTYICSYVNLRSGVAQFVQLLRMLCKFTEH